MIPFLASLFLRTNFDRIALLNRASVLRLFECRRFGFSVPDVGRYSHVRKSDRQRAHSTSNSFCDASCKLVSMRCLRISSRLWQPFLWGPDTFQSALASLTVAHRSVSTIIVFCSGTLGLTTTSGHGLAWARSLLKMPSGPRSLLIDRHSAMNALRLHRQSLRIRS